MTPRDRDVLCISWWEDGDTKSQPITWRLTVNTFGGLWSPSCARITRYDEKLMITRWSFVIWQCQLSNKVSIWIIV